MTSRLRLAWERLSLYLPVLLMGLLALGAGLGGAVKTGKNCNIYGELSKFAGQLTNDVQVNIGARWSF